MIGFLLALRYGGQPFDYSQQQSDLMPKSSSSTVHLICFSVIALIIASCCYFVMLADVGPIYAEHGLMENMQVGLIMLAGFVFIVQAVSSDARAREIMVFFALLSVIFVAREIDFFKMQGEIAEPLYWLLGTHMGKALFYVPALYILWRQLRLFGFYYANRGFFLRLPSVQYLMIAAFLLIVMSSIFDTKEWHFKYRHFFEELSELAAYCFYFAAALLMKANLKAMPAVTNTSH